MGWDKKKGRPRCGTANWFKVSSTCLQPGEPQKNGLFSSFVDSLSRSIIAHFYPLPDLTATWQIELPRAVARDRRELTLEIAWPAPPAVAPATRLQLVVGELRKGGVYRGGVGLAVTFR